MSKFTEWKQKRKLEKQAKAAQINKDSNDENTLSSNLDTNSFDDKQNEPVLKREIKDGILYLSTDDLVDIYSHSSVGEDEKVYIPKVYIDKYDLNNPSIKYVNVNGMNTAVDKFIPFESASEFNAIKQEIETKDSSDAKQTKVINSNDEVTIIQQLQSENTNTVDSLTSKTNNENITDRNNNQTILVSPILDPIPQQPKQKKVIQTIIAPTNSSIEIKQVEPKIYTIKQPSEDEITIIQQLQSEHKDTISSINDKIPNINDLTKNNNQRVLVSPILEPNEQEFNKTVVKPTIKSVVSTNDVNNTKQIISTIQLPSQEEVSVIQQLQSENTNTNQSLKNKSNIQTNPVNNNQTVLVSPIVSINDLNKTKQITSSIQLPSQDEVSIIQQLQLENKDTNESLIFKQSISKVNKTKNNIDNSKDVPEAYLKHDDQVKAIAKEDPIQKIDDSDQYLEQKYNGEKDYLIQRQNQINANNTGNNKKPITNKSINPTLEFVEVKTPAQKIADTQVYVSPIPESNDKQYTSDLYEAIKQEQVNQIYNSIGSDSAKVITISEPKLVTEFNRYKVDPRRKIYIIEEEDALKSFGILDDASIDQKVLFEGNVLKVYSAENSQLLTAPYGTIEDNYLNDNVFFLENNFTVGVERYIARTKINMNNFRVDVSYVAFRLPKDKRLIATRNANIQEYEAKIHNYFKDIGNAINEPTRYGNNIYISLATSHELDLTNNQTKVNNDLEKIKITKDGVNEKINLINIFNTFYEESKKPERRYDRRIKHFIRMIRQILMDSCYYAESGLLVLNYAEVLLFLEQYYDLNLVNVYDLSIQPSNVLLFDTAKYAIKNNLKSIDGYLKVNDHSYFIPLNYDYVLYDTKILNIVDDAPLDSAEVERVLLNRPLFTDAEFFNTSPSNFDRLRAISPYIDFVKYYEQKRIASMYTDSDLGKISNESIIQQLDQSYKNKKIEEFIEEQKPVAKEYLQYEYDETKNPIKDGIIYLSRAEFNSLYEHSHVAQDGTVYLDKEIANRYGLNNHDIKAVNVDGELIPLANFAKSKPFNNDETINYKESKIKDGVIYLSKPEFNSLYEHSHVAQDGTVYLDKEIANRYGLNNHDIKAVNVDGELIPLANFAKANEVSSKSQTNSSNEQNKQIEEYLVNKTNVQKDKSNTTKIEDGIIYLSDKDLVHLYQHSHVTEDGTVYLDKIEADKYGLNNANIKAISVNGQIIPLSSITKQEMDKELADEQEFIRAKEHSKKRSK